MAAAACTRLFALGADRSSHWYKSPQLIARGRKNRPVKRGAVEGGRTTWNVTVEISPVQLEGRIDDLRAFCVRQNIHRRNRVAVHRFI